VSRPHAALAPVHAAERPRQACFLRARRCASPARRWGSTACPVVALTQWDPVDALGATKLSEATGLCSRFACSDHPRTAHLRRLPYQKELAHEQHHPHR
jgi:hypothetical protein